MKMEHPGRLSHRGIQCWAAMGSQWLEPPPWQDLCGWSTEQWAKTHQDCETRVSETAWGRTATFRDWEKEEMQQTND